MSDDFSHPFFPKDVWFLKLDPPSSPYVSSDAVVMLVPKESTCTSKIGVRMEWSDIERPLMCTMFDPSRGAVAAKRNILNGYESMIGTNFIITVTLFYPRHLVDKSYTHERLMEEVARLLRDPSFKEDISSRDFTLVAGDGMSSVKVHSIILAARSSVLRAMLSMDSQEKQNRRMVFQGTPFHVLENFVDYLYWDRIPSFSSFTFNDREQASLVSKTMSMEQAIDLFIFSDQYDILGLKSCLEGVISCNIKNESSARQAKQVIAKIDSKAIEGALTRFLSPSSSSLS